MISGEDSLPYQETPEVLENGDTVYHAPCQTFEKINGQIVNQTDGLCLRQGRWIITDTAGNFQTGEYLDNHREGLWRQFNKKGKLLKESEEVSFGKEVYKVKEVDYSSGKPIIVIDKPLLAFYIRNLLTIMIVFFLLFFSRVLINSRIYNIENGTDFLPVYIHFGPLMTKNFRHSLFCTFTFWFFNYKPENKKLILLSNLLSVTALLIFFSLILLFAFN